ncbi:MAG: LON peptidase substrate-binding domain-containing protein [Chloroflexota bacterium]|nr:LON peptidase substrate-binding domain-containing protein [Chloroflexota bacterium]
MAGGPISKVMPVFPLNTVVFPRMPLPLHIFEERYRQMVRDLRDGDGRFCVALIKEGVEVGGEATPHDIGCVVELADTRELPDGRFYLVALGVERVRITALDRESKPYLLGMVEAWPEAQAEVAAPLLDRASKLFIEYARYRMALMGETLDNVTLPEEPDVLSYVLATAIELGAGERQRLLETPDTAARLDAEVALLQTEIPILRALTSTPQPSGVQGPFSRN